MRERSSRTSNAGAVSTAVGFLLVSARRMGELPGKKHFGSCSNQRNRAAGCLQAALFASDPTKARQKKTFYRGVWLVGYAEVGFCQLISASALLNSEGGFRCFLLICAKPRKRIIFFARQRGFFLGTFSAKTGVLRSKTPGFAKPARRLSAI